ncbi:MAG: hypothetical protein IKV94_02825 [Clostridia bacterium]|nr:hypothetical protein [Clostridia bacterium]MBR6517124.1 hypothetical protein [Bacilli bacterium]
MNKDVIFRYINGRIVPIKVNKDKTTNEYMNNQIKKKVTMKEYVARKEQEQMPLLQEFGYKPKEEKYRYKAQRLLDEYNKRYKK